jgi:hypothetical protein
MVADTTPRNGEKISPSGGFTLVGQDSNPDMQRLIRRSITFDGLILATYYWLRSTHSPPIDSPAIPGYSLVS